MRATADGDESHEIQPERGPRRRRNPTLKPKMTWVPFSSVIPIAFEDLLRVYGVIVIGGPPKRFAVDPAAVW